MPAPALWAEAYIVSPCGSPNNSLACSAVICSAIFCFSSAFWRVRKKRAIRPTSSVSGLEVKICGSALAVSFFVAVLGAEVSKKGSNKNKKKTAQQTIKAILTDFFINTPSYGFARRMPCEGTYSGGYYIVYPFVRDFSSVFRPRDG